MKIHKVSLNKTLLIDTVLASLIVQQVPKLLNNYLFSSSPLTGNMLEIAGGASAYLAGMLFGKNDIANIGLGLAGADILNQYVGGLLPGTSQTVNPTGPIKDYSNSPVLQLKDYNNSVSTVHYKQYESIYN